MIRLIVVLYHYNINLKKYMLKSSLIFMNDKNKLKATLLLHWLVDSMKTYQVDASEIPQAPVEVGSLSCVSPLFPRFFLHPRCLALGWNWTINVVFLFHLKQEPTKNHLAFRSQQPASCTRASKRCASRACAAELTATPLAYEGAVWLMDETCSSWYGLDIPLFTRFFTSMVVICVDMGWLLDDCWMEWFS